MIFTFAKACRNKKKKRLVEDKMDSRLSNEERVAALAVGTSYALVVGTSYFVLPNSLILEFYNYYLVLVF
jgi:hypothetical protein